MSTLFTMFATFVAFCSGVVFITEAVNRIFKVQGTVAKLIVSWMVSVAMAALGFGLQLGLFVEFGTPDHWQGWVKAFFVAIGCALCSNYAYDRDEIWMLLQQLFNIFKKK